MTGPDIIAYIPAFNEAGRIAEVVRQTGTQAGQVIVVDDGSADATSAVAREAGAEVLQHETNLGKGAAIMSALKHFGGTNAAYAVFLDADGQHDPLEIAWFVQAAAESGAGIVMGNRMQATGNMPAVRRVTNRIMSWLISRLAHQEIPDSQCGYRLLSRSVLGDLALTSCRFETETEMLIQAGRAGRRIVNVPIRTIYQAGRESHIQPLRDAVRFARLLWRYR